MAISQGRLCFFYPGGSFRLTFGQTAAPAEKDLMEQGLSRGLSPIQTSDYPYRPYHSTKPPLPQHPDVHGEAWDICPSVKNQDGEGTDDVAFWACGARQGTAKASGQAVLFRHRQKARPTAPLSPCLALSLKDRVILTGFPPEMGLRTTQHSCHRGGSPQPKIKALPAVLQTLGTLAPRPLVTQLCRSSIEQD